MNIREAILKAADSIEQNPELFNFGSIVCPSHTCGTPGCALGWIGYHLSRQDELGPIAVAERLGLGAYQGGLHDPAHVFYDRMDRLVGNRYEWRWQCSAKACATALRQYAEKYHPETIDESRQVVPWSECVWQPAAVIERAIDNWAADVDERWCWQGEKYSAVQGQQT